MPIGNILGMKNSSQLAENMNQLQEKSLSKYKSSAIVNFIADDGYTTFLNKIKPVCDEKGIKMDVAVITSWPGVTPGAMSLAQLKSLQSEGFGIVSHSKTHPNFTTKTEAEVRAECLDSLNWIKYNGFDNAENVLVVPYGVTPTDVANKNIIRDYYSYAFGVNNTPNLNPLDNFCINRYIIDTTDLATLKSYVDTAYTNKSYLVFLLHDGANSGTLYTGTKLQELSDLIDYIISKGMPIMTSHEALQYKGNDVFVGEYTQTNIAISKNGATNKNAVIPDASPYGNMDSPVTAYPWYTTTTVNITGANDTLTGEGGTMTIVRSTNYYSYALFVAIGGISTGATRVFYRKWNGLDSDGSWGEWKLLNTFYSGTTTANAASINAKNATFIMLNNYSTPTTITDITNGKAGQELTLYCTNTNVTIKHDLAKIRLSGGTDYPVPIRTTIKLVCLDNTIWAEVSRCASV